MTPKSERFEMRLEPEMMARVDDWIHKQDHPLSRAEAMRTLVERGLDQEQMLLRPSGYERMTLWMLAELLKQQQGFEDKGTADLIQEAVFGGHFWALEWELTGVLHSHTDSRKALREVVDSMDMWNFIERACERLSSGDQKRLEKSLDRQVSGIQFIGFDGNHETEHMSIARFLVEKLGRFERFKNRSMNSHMPRVGHYNRMFAKFDRIRPKLGRRELNVEELVEVLRRD